MALFMQKKYFKIWRESHTTKVRIFKWILIRLPHKTPLTKSIGNLNVLEDISGKSWGGNRRVTVSLYHGVNSSKTYKVSFMYHSATKLNLSQTSSTTQGFTLPLTNSVPESAESAVYMKSLTLYSPCGEIFSVLIVPNSTTKFCY
jgi:hypothetical protein